MDKERAGIQSVEVGFLLLEGLTRSRGPLMLKDLAASAGMSAAKAHRYLVSFQRLGLVVQDSRTAHYDLGPAALKLGLASLSRLDAVRLARERMPALMQTIGHTLALAVWGNRGPTIVHWEESPQAITCNNIILCLIIIIKHFSLWDKFNSYTIKFFHILYFIFINFNPF